jgi:hypothetical protein
MYRSLNFDGFEGYILKYKTVSQVTFPRMRCFVWSSFKNAVTVQEEAINFQNKYPFRSWSSGCEHNLTHHYTASQPRRSGLEFSSLWKVQISRTPFYPYWKELHEVLSFWDFIYLMKCGSLYPMVSLILFSMQKYRGSGFYHACSR